MCPRKKDLLEGGYWATLYWRNAFYNTYFSNGCPDSYDDRKGVFGKKPHFIFC